MRRYYNNTLINLFRGNAGNGISMGNSNIDVLLQRVNGIITDTEEFDNSFASVAYRDLQFILEYISKNNPDLRSNIELRKELLLSYDKTINDWEIYDSSGLISSSDLNRINELFVDIVYKVAEMPCDLMSFGQVMLKVMILNGRLAGQLPVSISVELLNQTSFQRYKDGYARVYTSDGLESVKIIGRDILLPSDDYGYIYVQDSELFTGGVLKVLLLTSIYHQYNNMEWLNFNTKLKGIIAGQYDLEKLFNSLTLLSQYQESLFGRKNKKNKETNNVVEQLNSTLLLIMDDLRNAGKNRVTVVPDSVEFKQFEIAGKQGFEAFREYDFLCKQLYENTYLGQSGNSLVSNASSYSGSGIKALQLNTQNKERSDRRVATKIMNQILIYYWSVWRGHNNSCPLRFRYGTESIEDAAANLKQFDTISRMSCNIPYRISPVDFCKKLGIPFDSGFYIDVPYIEIGGKINTHEEVYSELAG